MDVPKFDRQHTYDASELLGGLEGLVQCATGRPDETRAVKAALRIANTMADCTSWEQMRRHLLARLREHVAALERYAPNPEAN